MDLLAGALGPVLCEGNEAREAQSRHKNLTASSDGSTKLNTTSPHPDTVFLVTHTHTRPEQTGPLAQAVNYTLLHNTPMVTALCPAISCHIYSVPPSLSTKTSGPETPTYLEQVRELLSGHFLKFIDVEAALPALSPCKGEEGGDQHVNGCLHLSQWLCCHSDPGGYG